MKLFGCKQQIPSLPQDDPDPSSRQKQLKDAQTHYRWTLDKENLNGIPMAEEVLDFEHRSDFPTLKWSIKFFEIILSVILNSLSERTLPPKSAKKQSNCIWANLLNSLWLLLRIFLNLAMKILPKLLAKNLTAEDLDAQTKHKQFLWAFTKTVFVPVVTDTRHKPENRQVQKFNQLYQDFQHYLVTGDDVDNINAYAKVFHTLPIPELAKNFMDDAQFANLRVAGSNPMLLQLLDAMPSKFPVSKQEYAKVMSGDDLFQALQDKRIYILDYAELQALAEHPGTKLNASITTEVYAPIALFALTPDRSQFRPVAIQVAQNLGAKQPIVYATSDEQDSHYWDWQLAKSVVQNADTNYLELLLHLARTHLLIEAFAIATPRNLAESHPLYQLLIPHVEGTLFINELAARMLVDQGGGVDQVFGANIAAVQAAAGADRLNLDFYATMLPTDLAKRGLLDSAQFPNFPYRDDGLLIWDAIHTWVTAYLAIYYAEDASVLADTELAAWTQDLIDSGKVKGFKVIESRAQLADVLTMVIFTASAQHAAVNFPQSTLMSYLPAFPGSLLAYKSVTGNTEATWLQCFPPIAVAQAQLDLFWLLGSVYYTKLGEYQTNSFPYCSQLSDTRVTQANGPLQQFKQNLQAIEKQVQQRNQSRPPYIYLQPSRLPASINV